MNDEWLLDPGKAIFRVIQLPRGTMLGRSQDSLDAHLGKTFLSCSWGMALEKLPISPTKQRTHLANGSICSSTVGFYCFLQECGMGS